MKYIHLKSNELVNGNPKLPPVSGMQVGEIAINYKDGYETLFIKNDNNEIVSFSSDDIIIAQAGGGGAAIDGLFSSVTYNSSAKKIYFYDKNNTQCGEVDTTDFIKEGMISSVTVSNGNLVISFNTDAGRQDINLELTQIFNPSNYYTKNDIDGKGYLTGYTETDPTISAWAKAASKPSYTLDEVSDGTTRKLTDYATQANFTAHTADTTVHVTTSDKSTWNGKQDAINDLSSIRNNASSGATAYSTVTAHTADTTVHVTASDKSTWNGKQSAISDLAEIRSNAASGASAYTGYTAHSADSTIHVTSSEKSTWNGKQNSISDLATIRNNASSGKNAYDNMVTGVTAGGTNLTKSNKVVAIPSASSSTFGVVKTGDFITNTNGTIKVKTGTTANDVSVGNHTHSAYATTGNLNTLSSQTVNHITASTLHMPAVTSSDNGKILQVVNGAWALVTPVSIYYGSTAPDNNMGNDGDIYIQQ